MNAKNTTAGAEAAPYDNDLEGCECEESGAECGRHPWPAREDEAGSDDDGVEKPSDEEMFEVQDDAVVQAWAIGQATRAQREREVMASSSRYTGAIRG